ncbi:putative aminoacyltransferase, E1 ubiquitin-activating enzyme [Rosa chinensis]|uniref:U-box domain-containing protein n=1 Tax=Rosa chinensis TaxID=74649 RepID=A0A2P6P1Q1_ROSCH|nr:U-box domain-containing protein 21 [Rosa chinensis]PRQ15850.1 putative aminoacyltransferase, E1 ubiquitin-activating enzyme [Rosa chinensis]
MVLGWRRRSSTGHRAAAAKKKPSPGNLDMDQLVIPKHFLCPISLDLMKDPVTLSSGITYDRQSIDTWLEAGNFNCPVTNQVLRNFDMIPNHTLRTMIQDWSAQNQRYGIQRVPTPRIPIMAVEVSEILFSITASARRVDQNGCLECVQIIKKWAAEGDRNKRCIVENGAASVLASAFDAFASDGIKKNARVCEEILSALSWMMFPSLDEETQKYLGSHASLDCLVWFLKVDGDLLVKQNSILALKELLSNSNDQNKHAVEALAEIEGVNKILFGFIKEKSSMTITKSSLTVVFYLVSFSEKLRSAFLEMGLVSLLLETLLDSEKGVTERALYVLDCLCDCKEGREQAYANALTIPVLVKKILRVSDMATEYSISAVWKLCKNATRQEERVLVEALQVGAFQKLLVVLQVRCAGEYDTKDKPTELLKLLNPYRAGLECIESVDFKSIKRSF